MNGNFSDGWVRFVRLIQEAGADALELNVILLPTDPTMSGEEIELRYLEIGVAIRQQLQIPLAVKLGPYFSSLPHFARRLMDAGERPRFV